MFEKQLGRLFVLLLGILFIGSAIAATERYDYDPLGRLVRMVDGASQVTDYIYDAAGNLLQVRTNGAATAPVVSGITPASLRRGETKAITIIGSGFLGASVTAAEPALDIAGLQVTATQIQFNLAASASAPIGTQSLTISSAAGSATASITVAPLLPKVNVDPAPLAIPPDNVLRRFTIRLSQADTIDHTIALSASNTKIAVSPASVTIPAGQTSVQANITGVSAGQSTITLASTTLGTTLVPVFVTAEFRGITTSVAPMLGVVLENLPNSNQTQITPMLSRPLGVLVGSAMLGISPDRLNVGTGPIPLTINGVGLTTAQTVSIEPNTGLTVGSPVVAADGLTVTVPVTVAAGAPVAQRRVIVKNAANVEFPAVNSSADRLNIVRPVPQIDSIEPLFATTDTTLTLTVRGRNLQEANRILYSPSTGIATDAAPIINSDGTVLTAGVAVALNAAIRDYAVAVVTPGGTSNTVAGVSNTFKVVNAIRQSVTPIMAPAVGVVLQDVNAPVSSSAGLVSPGVGIAFGSVATDISPKVGIIGQNMTLTIQGIDLTGVSGVTFSPITGLTLGSVTVAPDGKSLIVPVTIATDAPQTLRKVKVMAGLTEINFVSPEAAQFRVSLPLPELDSVTPIVLRTGQPSIPLTVRGRNFQNASQVKVTPASDTTISAQPEISGDGAEITVNISAAAGAALGTRVVSVVTPAGESSVALVPANTITFAGTAGSTLSPILSIPLGVVKLDGTVVPSIPVGPVLSPALGLVLQEVPAPVTTISSQFSNKLGVLLGPTALSLDANGFAPGFSGTLVVRGYQLNSVTGISAAPAAGITFGAPTVAPDGAQVSVPITVDAAAAPSPRTLKLNTATGTINFSDPFAAQLRVGPGVPEIDSITPILAKQGDLVTMTIRGRKFLDAEAVVAMPDSGISFIPGTMAVNADGTQMTVSFTIASTTPIGSRVIQIVVPGATSDATPVPANTFTVFAP